MKLEPRATEILAMFEKEASKANFTVFSLPDAPREAYHSDDTHLFGEQGIQFYEKFLNEKGL